MLINICVCPMTVSVQYSRVSKVIIKYYIRKWFSSFSWAEMTLGGIRSFYDNKVKARRRNIISTTRKYPKNMHCKNNISMVINKHIISKKNNVQIQNCWVILFRKMLTRIVTIVKSWIAGYIRHVKRYEQSVRESCEMICQNSLQTSNS